MTRAARARRAWVEAHLRTHCFATPAAHRGAGPTFGAEIELLAHQSMTGRPAPLQSRNGEPDTVTVVRTVSPDLGWREERSANGIARFVGSDGGVLTFEPGGQLEYASATHRVAGSLVRELRTVLGRLQAAARDAGISLLACGIDPINGPSNSVLQLDSERYLRMDAHFARIGPAGARMMRQTASLQLCVGGIEIGARWALANALAPWLVALFANSCRYAGRDTGFASYRAETWREVDPTRTGVFGSPDQVGEYTDFALAAGSILTGSAEEAARPFAELAEERVDLAVLERHLSTLFPEVRPRGYLELRSADAVGPEQFSSAIAFTIGLLADETSAREAVDLLPAPDAVLLRTAGWHGMRDVTIARHADDLCSLALEGCVRLGPSVVDPAMIDEARTQLRHTLEPVRLALQPGPL